MTRRTGPDCAVMCNLINIHTYIHTVELIAIALYLTMREAFADRDARGNTKSSFFFAILLHSRDTYVCMVIT